MIFLVPNCEAKANGLIKADTNDDRFVSTQRSAAAEHRFPARYVENSDRFRSNRQIAV